MTKTIRALVVLGLMVGGLAVLHAQEPAMWFRGLTITQGNLVVSTGSITAGAGNLTLTSGDLDITSTDTAVADQSFTLTSTQSSTSASTSYEPFLVTTTLTGAGQVGGRGRFYMTSNVALGAWSNALKAEVVYGASGRTTGLGSSLLAEMTLSAGTTSGTYAPLEVELNLGSGASVGTATSLASFGVNGAASATFDTSGYLFDVNVGSAASGKVFQANTAADATHALRVRINGTAYYLMLTDTGA